MKGIRHLELMPEPEEPSLLTAVDLDAPGYPGDAYGVSDEEARELRWPFGPMVRFLWPWGAVGFSATVAAFILLYPSIAPLLGEVLPDSEWAYEDSGIRALQENGNFGEGTRVCIVDTGIDISHPEFSGVNLVGFRDFYASNSNETRDIGYESHGTLMAGLLVSNDSFIGAAPGVSLSVAIALGPSGKSTNERMVSQAIRWCRISQNADIISLSLGSEPGSWVQSSSETIDAVKEALGDGIFVVAAAGNADDDSNNSDVSTPASIEGVISVGAHGKDGNPWRDTASGSDVDPFSGEERSFPNQKPEILAPGVLLWSCISTEYSPPYAYSSGTSDSTVLVTGALALILNLYGDEIAGEDGKIDSHEMSLVKVALAKSARSAPGQINAHDDRMGYGLLDAEEWANQVSLEFEVEE
ncbi:MAG: S8 family serine peptidase [Candidatus Thermoplasmatota archaeon]|nr:S8 family serine peptidase [Candidatus Thermoplasmatota archaeon]